MQKNSCWNVENSPFSSGVSPSLLILKHTPVTLTLQSQCPVLSPLSELIFHSLSLSAPPSFLSWPFFSPLSDMNANPNKRQRQPALLGDHPPEYGKACGVHAFTHLTHLLANGGLDVKTTTNWGVLITVAARWCCVDVKNFNLSEGCGYCLFTPNLPTTPTPRVYLSFVDPQEAVITDTKKRAMVLPMKGDGWGRPWVVGQGVVGPVSVTVDSTVPLLRLQENMVRTQTPQWSWSTAWIPLK